jgi:ribosome maturation protein Sdo1
MAPNVQGPAEPCFETLDVVSVIGRQIVAKGTRQLGAGSRKETLPDVAIQSIVKRSERRGQNTRRAFEIILVGRPCTAMPSDAITKS